jgi:hypothetical protein
MLLNTTHDTRVRGRRLPNTVVWRLDGMVPDARALWQ